MALLTGTVPVRDRLLDMRDGIARSVTPLGAFVVLASAVMTLSTAVMYAVGTLVRHALPLDRPVFDFVHAHQNPGAVAVMQVVTQLGNKQECWLVSAVTAILFALVANRRRWAGLVILGSMVVLQHYQQVGLAELVHRGHPPGSGGTFPSGGSVRVIAVYGACLLVLLSAARLARPWWRAAWCVIGVLALAEGATRLLLDAHWLTDVLSGWLCGVLLLVGFAFAARPLLAPDRADAVEAGG
ncbi:MAG TPA: phosphatase PAP2 family protein [Streptosporangiales bacterium]